MSSIHGSSDGDIQPGDTVGISPVQHQAQLLAALRAHDLNSFTQLLQQSAADADSACLESACREPDCTQFVQLLLQHRTDPNSLNPVLQETPLHITAELGHYEVLQVLLHDSRIDVNALNGSDQTALHLAVKKCGEVSRENANKFRQCITLLLDWPSNVRELVTGTQDSKHSLEVNALDWLGNTALHYATQNKDQDTILTLLEHGSYIGLRNHAGEMPISGIEPETLEKFFNTRLKMPTDESLLFKYDFLVPPADLYSVLPKDNLLSDKTDDVKMKLSSPCPEMDPIIEISVSSGLRHLILHPILSSFIHLKWQHTKNFYYYNIAFYIMFVSLLTFVILHHYITARRHHQEHDQSCWSQLTVACFFTICAWVLLGMCCFCLLVKLIFQLSISPIQYLRKLNTYPQLGLTLLAITVLFMGWSPSENSLTAVTLFLAWTRLLILTGEHPAVSIHFQLFRKVSCTFLKQLAWYFLLIVAFSLSFYALFHNSKTYIPERSIFIRLFHNPLTSLFTTVGMLFGGFETKFLPFESAFITSHFIFILFMFFLTLVLLNVFTGLAVSQTQNVQSKSELVHLRAKVNVVSDIERLLLGNPQSIHLRMRQLYLSRNPVVAWVVKSTVYLWLLCNWLRCFRNLHRSVILFPDSTFDQANILFPFGCSSKVTCNYRMDHRVLRLAANIVKEKDDRMRQQGEYEAMFRSYEERLSSIEASLMRSETVQRDILQLLQAQELQTSM